MKIILAFHRVSRAISLNASMFAAVCLASRLPSSSHVYVYVMFAVQMFALFPEFRKDVKVCFVTRFNKALKVYS